MSELYRIRPRDKKSVETSYDVYKTMPDGSIKGWSVSETYRWGQGFVESKEELPHLEDKYICVDSSVGWGVELDDNCSTWFEFDDSFTDEEKEEIEKLWHEGGPAWLFDESDWEIEDDSVTIHGPFLVDKVEESEYNKVIEENIELTPRPKLDPSKAWPF